MIRPRYLPESIVAQLVLVSGFYIAWVKSGSPAVVTGTSASGGRADVPATWPDSLLAAEGVEEVGADRFCATIVLVGWA